jgi:LEA14-like dessication related protein
LQKAASAFATLAFLLMVAGCAGLPGAPVPEIRNIEARIAGINFDETNMAFDVTVYNPFLVAIRTPRFRYDLEIEGSTFLSSVASGSEHLPAGATSIVVLPVRISYHDLFRSYPELRKTAEVGYRLRVALGPSRTRPVEIPFYHEGTIPTLRPPVATAAKVRLADVSLNQATLVVDAEVENPNVIEMNISHLSYELNLSDIRAGVRSVSADETTIGPGQRVSVTLAGEITSSDGLIELLISGVSGAPNLSVSGPVRTPYGKAVISQ